MKIETLKSETRARRQQEFGAGACECTRLVSDNEHWPQIRSAIHHRTLLPNAHGLGRGKNNVLSGTELLASNFPRVENKALFPACIGDVRN